jgi:hypothetical protein
MEKKPSVREKVLFRAMIADAITVAVVDSGASYRRGWLCEFRGEQKYREKLYEMIYPCFTLDEE